MSEHYILKDRTPVAASLLEWARWFENREARRVGRNEVKGFEVSTVFLGLDHNFSGVGAPVLFETMVFGEKRGDDLYCERYSTYEEAEAGHAKVVAALESGKKPEELYATEVAK